MRTKRKRTNYEISDSIRKNKKRVIDINNQIKTKSITKNKLLNKIENDIDELTNRFNKQAKSKDYKQKHFSGK